MKYHDKERWSYFVQLFYKIFAFIICHNLYAILLKFIMVCTNIIPFVHLHTTPQNTTPHQHTTPTYHTTPRHAMPRHATPRHAMPCHATPRHATPHHNATHLTTPHHTTPHHTTTLFVHLSND